MSTPTTWPRRAPSSSKARRYAWCRRAPPGRSTSARCAAAAISTSPGRWMCPAMCSISRR